MLTHRLDALVHDDVHDGPGEVLAAGHAGHPRQPRGQVREALEHRLEEGDQVHQPGRSETWALATTLELSTGNFTVQDRPWPLLEQCLHKHSHLEVHSAASRTKPAPGIHSFD